MSINKRRGLQFTSHIGLSQGVQESKAIKVNKSSKKSRLICDVLKTSESGQLYLDVLKTSF